MCLCVFRVRQKNASWWRARRQFFEPCEPVKPVGEKQLVSDVPVAISLSGGVDSNLIFSIMNKKIGNKFKTYSVRFEDGTNIDADVAKINSQAHNLENIQINVSHDDFIESLEKIEMNPSEKV